MIFKKKEKNIFGAFFISILVSLAHYNVSSTSALFIFTCIKHSKFAITTRKMVSIILCFGIASLLELHNILPCFAIGFYQMGIDSHRSLCQLFALSMPDSLD
jgi:hypothetical protein